MMALQVLELTLSARAAQAPGPDSLGEMSWSTQLLSFAPIFVNLLLLSLSCGCQAGNAEVKVRCETNMPYLFLQSFDSAIVVTPALRRYPRLSALAGRSVEFRGP
jgi:hypothetical protein